MNKFVLCLAVFVLVFESSAQLPEKAVKIAEYNERSEAISSFTKKTKLLIQRLSDSPTGTRAFITIKAQTYKNQVKLESTAKNLMSDRPDISGRIELSKAGFYYFPEFEKTEFWLIPLGASSPYRPYIKDPLPCPALTVHGDNSIKDRKEKLLFTATVGADVTYHWSVKGGTIVVGQDTPSITVTVNDSRVNEVTAKVKIRSSFPTFNCVDTGSATTKLKPS